MSSHQHHEEIIRGLEEEMKPILESSAQGIYVYLDDNHKFCNEAFSKMLGYASAEEWAGMQGQFPVLFVDEKSQGDLIGAYQDAMEKMAASTSSITWKKKGSGTVASSVILVPIAYQGHVLAMHFVSA